jgi:ATP-dependent protease ClpP protease subunit
MEGSIMINYKIDKNNRIIHVDKSSKVALKDHKQTDKDIVYGMIDNLDDTFSNPQISQEILDSKYNEKIDKDIEKIERKNARAVRELILNPNDTVARGLVQKADDDIKALRDQRK